MNLKLRSLRLSLIALSSAGLMCSDAQAATAANAYVVVASPTYGVESIVPIGTDFHVTTRNVGKPSFSCPETGRRTSGDECLLEIDELHVEADGR